MNSPYRMGHRILGPGLLAVAIIAFLSHPGMTQSPPNQLSASQREQQISELEKQIAELQTQLKTLKEKELLPNPKTILEDSIPKDYVKNLRWRNIGPPNMGGRIAAMTVFDKDPSIYWIATAGGGLLKTSNNGSTAEHQFDREATVSIGAVAVAPSNSNIVWVGTGEANPRNSVSYGDGVYKSVDGGKTWTNMGLKKSFQIGSITIHPTNPEVVYVGALGRLYGPNEERGLFKTTDGGKTWNRVLYVDDKTGVLDIAMNPTDPETLLVATWERKRDEFDSFRGDAKSPEGTDGYAPVVTHGAGTGLWKTSDGGKSFKRLTKGLPTVKMGRIGLDYYRKNPNIVFATIDTENAGKGLPPTNVYLGIYGEDEKGGTKLTVTEGSPAEKGGLKNGDILTSLDGKPVKAFADVTGILAPKKPNDKIKVEVLRGKEKVSLEITLGTRPGTGGGRQGGGRQGGGPGGKSRPGIGVSLEEADNGIKITEVTKDGPAEKAGVKAGDVIVKADDITVADSDQQARFVLAKILFSKSAGDKIKLELLRGKEKKEVEVTMTEGQPSGFGPPGGQGQNQSRPYSGGQLGGQRENVQDQQGPDGWQTGGIYKSTDNGETWVRVNSYNPRPFYFSVVKVDPNDENIVWSLGVDLKVSTDGGKTFSGEFNGKDTDGKELKYSVDRGVHSDQHAMWINPQNSKHLIICTDGGFYVSYDRGANWEHMNHFALGQFYHVAVDNQQPYNAYGGLQDNGTWGGPSQTFRQNGPTNEDFTYINGGDGFVCRVDPNNPSLVYAESQDGNMMRRDLKTGSSRGIRPRGAAGTGPYRWNWNTPFILSSHNPNIFYCAGNYVFRSVKQGDELKLISPEITRTKRGSGTAVAESPKNQDILWAGTDDGAVWVTRDGGKQWTDVSKNFEKAGLPGPRWVSSIEASKADEKRAYVVFDAHRSDDDEPYVFVTEDLGQTWKSLRSNLPVGSTRVLREDIVNPNLLYLGTEFAAYASIDRGEKWTKINAQNQLPNGVKTGLPTVAIHEFAQPTTANELVAATHGRSLWILDVTSLRQMTKDVARGKTTLFTPSSVVRWNPEIGKEGMFSTGTRRFAGQNPPRGTYVEYALEKKASKVSLKILDITGKSVRELTPSSAAGFHSVFFDLRRVGLRPGFPSGGNPGAIVGGELTPGQYRVVLNVDGQELSQAFSVEGDPRFPRTTGVGEEEARDEVEEMRYLQKLLKEKAPEVIER